MLISVYLSYVDISFFHHFITFMNMVFERNEQFSNSKRQAKNKAKYMKKRQRISIDGTRLLDSNLEPEGDVITNVFVPQPSPVVQFHDGPAGDTN